MYPAITVTRSLTLNGQSSARINQKSEANELLIRNTVVEKFLISGGKKKQVARGVPER